MHSKGANSMAAYGLGCRNDVWEQDMGDQKSNSSHQTTGANAIIVMGVISTFVKKPGICEEAW